MKVEKDPFRSKRAMDPPQGVDHALQFNASQRMGEDGHVEGVGEKLRLADIRHDKTRL